MEQNKHYKVSKKKQRDKIHGINCRYFKLFTNNYFNWNILCWIFLIKSMIDTIRMAPYLDRFERKEHSNPKVSVILPARNEEKFIGKCLDSLIDQDYSNYEIIVIDDSSDDATSQIILEYAKKNSKIISVKAQKKPDGWMGKNWACMEGYKNATGELLLFTDADTKHSQNVISLAVSHLLSFRVGCIISNSKITYNGFLDKNYPSNDFDFSSH